MTYSGSSQSPHSGRGRQVEFDVVANYDLVQSTFKMDDKTTSNPP